MTYREFQHLEPYAGFLSLHRNGCTRYTYTQGLFIFKIFLDRECLDPSRVATRDVLRFAASLDRPGFSPTGKPRQAYSALTARNILSTVRNFYRYLMAVDAVAQDPARILCLVKIKKPIRQPRALNPFDRRRLLSALRIDSLKNLQISLTVRLAFECGLRKSEIAGLKVQDVDLSSGVLTVIGKGDKQRTVPVTWILATWLRLWLQKRGYPGKGQGRDLSTEGPSRLKFSESPYIFPNIRDPLKKHVSRNVLNRRMKRAAAWAGLSRVLTVHVLRHSFATQLAETGASAYEIRDLLGHTTTQMTETYVHLADGAGQRAHHRAFDWEERKAA